MSSAIIATRTPGQRLKALLGSLIGPSNVSLFPFIPRPIKLLVLLLFFLNKRSWPFVWHFRVFRSVIEIRWEALFKARTTIARKRWANQISCINADPFEVVSVSKSYAGVDDCDYNGHLSNSSYAKNVDPARMRAAIDAFPAVFAEGVWMALGGAHYHFLHEIPYGVEYEIRTSIGSWEDKWMFLVHHFVSYPKPGSKHAKRHAQPPKTSANGTPTMTAPSTQSLVTTPVEGLSRSTSQEKMEKPTPYQRPDTLPLHKLRTPLPPNAVVHCIAVSQYCFKIGRITIPPRVVFIAAGYGDPSKKRWDNRVQDLLFPSVSTNKAVSEAYKKAKSSKGGKPPRPMAEIFKGGWRTESEPSSEHAGFWELPEYEAKRQERMATVFGGILKGFSTLGQIARD